MAQREKPEQISDPGSWEVMMASGHLFRQRQGPPGTPVGGECSVVKGQGLWEEGTGQKVRGSSIYSDAHSHGHGQAVHSLHLSSLMGTGRSLD